MVRLPLPGVSQHRQYQVMKVKLDHLQLLLYGKMGVMEVEFISKFQIIEAEMDLGRGSDLH